MTDSPSRLQRLIEERLNTPLPAFVARRRGEGAAWRVIAADVEQRTGIECSHTWLRRRFSDQPAEVTS